MHCLPMRRALAEAAEKVEAARERDGASLALARDAEAQRAAAVAMEERVRAEAAAAREAAQAAERDAQEARQVWVHPACFLDVPRACHAAQASRTRTQPHTCQLSP